MLSVFIMATDKQCWLTVPLSLQTLLHFACHSQSLLSTVSLTISLTVSHNPVLVIS